MFGRLPKGPMARALFIGNLALLVLFPLAWTAPLIRAGILPVLHLDEVSIISGLGALWSGGEWMLAILVGFFALIVPLIKIGVLVWVHLGGTSARALIWVQTLGKLAMADVFLIAVYIIVAKGLAIGRVETAWGLWFFTFCVLASLAIGMVTARLSSTLAAARAAG